MAVVASQRKTNASRLGIEDEITKLQESAKPSPPDVARMLDERVVSAIPVSRLLPGEEPSDGWVEDRLSRNDSEEYRMVALYSDGATDAEVAAALRMTKRAWQERYQVDPEFARLVDFGATLREAFWSRAGRKGLFMAKFNTSLYQFLTKHNFGWGPGVGKEESEKNTTDSSAKDAKEKLKQLLQQYQG